MAEHVKPAVIDTTRTASRGYNPERSTCSPHWKLTKICEDQTHDMPSVRQHTPFLLQSTIHLIILPILTHNTVTCMLMCAYITC